MNEFEQRLRQAPMKPVPADWRAEILAAAQPVAPTAARDLPKRAFQPWWQALLWPHPKAWAGLAAVWIIILGLNVSQRDDAPVRAEKSSPPSAETLVELRQQQQMLAELLGGHELPTADRPKTASPQPHAQRCLIMAV
jgi:hypothetical protein